MVVRQLHAPKRRVGDRRASSINATHIIAFLLGVFVANIMTHFYTEKSDDDVVLKEAIKPPSQKNDVHSSHKVVGGGLANQKEGERNFYEMGIKTGTDKVMGPGNRGL